MRGAENPGWSGILPVEAPRCKSFDFLGEAAGEVVLPANGELAIRTGAVLGTCAEESRREVGRGVNRSGLVHGEFLGEFEADMDGVRSVGGLGESGTFHKLASSGRSSSESLYSASSSFIDFRLGCQEPRLACGFIAFIGTKLGRRGAAELDPFVGAGEAPLGDGLRDRLRLLMAVIAKDGVEGLVKALLGGPGIGRLAE